MAKGDDELFHEVSELLGPRHGWGLEMSTSPGGSPSWCFESHGEVELSVSVDRARVIVYLSSEDKDLNVGGVDGLTAWLEDNEDRFRRP